MEMNLLKEAIECLSDQRRLVHYHDDQYALYLLQQYCFKENCLNKGKQASISISDLKSTQFAKLLQRPKIKELLAGFGDGKIVGERLQDIVINNYKSYVITLSRWGCKKCYSWNQTSAPGANLVMQLNFTNQHDQYLVDLKIDASPFKYRHHPIHRTKSSLSWARIDFDLDTGEALIEEIQNDWLRRASTHARWAKRALLNGQDFYKIGNEEYSAGKMLEYTNDLLDKYQKCWHETTLFYAIKLIREELGIKNIFYHSFETGAVLKDMGDWLPPRSLYTDLPKQFCFSRSKQGPEFIVNNPKIKRKLKKLKNAHWFQLNL